MDEHTFRALVDRDLAPLLESVVSTDVIPSTTRDRLASYGHPCRLLVKPSRKSTFRVAIDRSQSFEAHEKKLAGQFIDELSAIVALRAGDFEGELLQGIPRRMVAKHLGAGSTLRNALERLETWSSQTYEGQRIVAAIGILPGPDEAAIELKLEDFWEQDFAPVLSNGFDTLLEVSSNGRICGLRQLGFDEVPGFAPYRLRQIAAWADGQRVAAVLNRHGEVLVFQDKRLRFLRRHGRWSHYSHETNLRRLSPPQSRALRTALYSSCLDVSFARSGGCLGIVSRQKLPEFDELVSTGDKLAVASSFKAKLMSLAVGVTFDQLDRRLRQELLSMDGALIVDYRGTVLAAGAIIEVPAGSVGGGGRLAAAKQLSTVGVGIKISEDGSVTGFRNEVEMFRA